MPDTNLDIGVYFSMFEVGLQVFRALGLRNLLPLSQREQAGSK